MLFSRYDAVLQQSKIGKDLLVTVVDHISTYKGITMFAALVVGRCCLRANEFSSKRVLLLMVDCWIVDCNSNYQVKHVIIYFFMMRQWVI